MQSERVCNVQVLLLHRLLSFLLQRKLAGLR